MFKNIQKYLLIHRPLLWNIRIVPVLICTALINLLFFAIGYLFTYTGFESLYAYNYTYQGLTYFVSIIAAILSFIFWMIYYSKNNAFKAFYPKSTGKLYLEWLLIFVIVLSMVAYPFSYSKGKELRIKSYVTKTEMIEAAKILNKVSILIPVNKTDYYSEYPPGYSPDSIHRDSIGTAPAEAVVDTVADAEIDISSITITETRNMDELIKEAEEAKKTFEDYPGFTQLSLLNYKGYSYFYIPSTYDIDAQGVGAVKKWLVNKDREEIETLMDSFLSLIKKHNLKTNLTRDKWMELVYNPDKYPVGDFNIIYSWDIHDPLSYYSRYDNYGNEIDPATTRFVQYRELAGAYSTIMSAYMDKRGNRDQILATFCYALFFALMVFSFRATAGKPWLIAFVSGGVILLIFLFFTLIFESFGPGVSSFYLFAALVLALFAGECVYMLFKIGRNGAVKGRSNVVVNHLVWYIPVVPALLILLMYYISQDTHQHELSCQCVYHYIDTYWWPISWGNIVLAFVSMWCFIRFVLLKWKSLPEE